MTTSTFAADCPKAEESVTAIAVITRIVVATRGFIRVSYHSNGDTSGKVHLMTKTPFFRSMIGGSEAAFMKFPPVRHTVFLLMMLLFSVPASALSPKQILVVYPTNG